ncbi:MAG: type III-B CRISPR module-associated protein Cmr3 [Verrucomicrobiales bacterium]|nr:type III-B CRISPR module-associated protein Cmr3 [Verrucomicrobiales bacterium]
MRPTFTPVLLEPTDVLFFRDSIPMSAGQGRGHGCRLPWPSTLHEAFRSTLLLADGNLQPAKTETGRDLGSRSRRELGRGVSVAVSPSRQARGQTHVASTAYQSLRTLGPFPWLERNERTRREHGLFLPVPLDAQVNDDDHIHPLELLRQANSDSTVPHIPCLPVSSIPASKKTRLGWWTTDQYSAYLKGDLEANLAPLPDSAFWEAEHRIGLEIEPGTFGAKSGQLYSGAYLRPRAELRLAAWTSLVRPRDNEAERLARLPFLLLGGERRLARLWPGRDTALPEAPIAASDGPCLLKWVLVTPAVFAHGWLPGWCKDSSPQQRPAGEVCLQLPGRARLVAACLGKSVAFAGWDAVDGTPKETRLAVPAGSVYYFLCDSPSTAKALIAKLHCDLNSADSGPRSDFFGEKGFGFGLCSTKVEMHPSSVKPEALAAEVFR